MIILASSNTSILGSWGDALRDSRPVSSASSLRELKSKVADAGPVCVVLDRNFPVKGKSDPVKQVRKANSQAKIVLVSEPGHPSSDTEDLAFLKAGVCGLCRTDMDADMIRKVMNAVDHGQFWVRRSLIPALVDELSRQAKGAISISKTSGLL